MEKIEIPALDTAKAAEVRAGFAKMEKAGQNLGKLEEMVVQ